MKSASGNKKYWLRQETAVSMIQFTLVAPLLFIIVLAIVDIGRYRAAQMALQYAAYRAVQKAASTPNLDSDIIGLQPKDPVFENFVQARRRVCNVAKELLLGTFFTDSATSSPLMLREFEQVDYWADGSGSAPSYKDDCVVLRPGERAKEVSSGTFYNHPTLKPQSSGKPPKEDPKIYLEEHDVVVRLSAEIDLIFPFFADKVAVTAESSAPRQLVPEALVVIDRFNPTAALVTTTTTTTVTTTTATTSSTTTTWPCTVDFSVPGCSVGAPNKNCPVPQDNVAPFGKCDCLADCLTFDPQ